MQQCSNNDSGSWGISNEWIVMHNYCYRLDASSKLAESRKRYPKQNSRIMMEIYKGNNLASIGA